MLRKTTLILILLAGVLPQIALNQAPHPHTAPDTTVDEHPPTPDEVRRQRSMEKERLHQRYIDMQRDTDKLLQLATELKKEVDSAGQGTLSLDVVKTADSIEKLAKSVKQRMKGD